MLNKRLMLASSMLAATLIVSSCSSKDGGKSPSADEGKGTTNAPVQKREPAEIVFYSLAGDPESAFDLKYGADLKKKFPEYTFKFIQNKAGQRIPELFVTNQRIDIIYHFFEDILTAVVNNGLQLDMTDLAKKHNVDVNKLDSAIIQGIQSSSDGKLYVMPLHSATQVLYTNKEIFDRFGLSYPKDGMTWGEVAEISRRLTRKDQDTQYFGFVPFVEYVFKTNSYSLPYLDPKTGKSTLQNDLWKKVMQEIIIDPTNGTGYREWVQSKKAIPPHVDFRIARVIAMQQMHSDLATAYFEDFGKFNWDYTAFPTFKDAPNVGPQPLAQSMAITNQAANKDAAMEVLAFLLSSEHQKTLAGRGKIPALNDVRNDPAIQKILGQDTTFKDKNWGALLFNKSAPIAYRTPYEGIAYSAYGKVWSEVLVNNKDLNTTLREQSEAADKAVENAK